MKNPITRIVISTLVLSAAAWFGGCAGSSTKQSTGEYIDDGAITTKVKAEMARDSQVSALDVHVQTFKGTVELSGFVDTAAQKSRAGELAKQVAGVQKVENKLSVK
ncbi:MAG: BON domain-containing protein [Nibricoccus sp.]